MASGDLSGFLKFIKDNKWNFLHIQAISYRQNTNWDLIYARIILIYSDIQIHELDIRDENVAFFQVKLDFSKFTELFQEMTNGKLTLNGLESKFGFLTSQPTIEFHPRSTVNELFEVNETSFYLQYGGKHPLSTLNDDLNKQVFKLGYKDLHHACKVLFSRNYGQGSHSPYISLIAPTFVDFKIEIILPKKILKTKIIYQDYQRLQKTKIIIYQKGPDNNYNGPHICVEGLENRNITLLNDTTSLEIETYYDGIEPPIEKLVVDLNNHN